MKRIKKAILAITLLALGAVNVGCTAQDLGYVLGAGAALGTAALIEANNPGTFSQPAAPAASSYSSSSCTYRSFSITGPDGSYMSCTQDSMCNVSCY